MLHSEIFLTFIDFVSYLSTQGSAVKHFTWCLGCPIYSFKYPEDLIGCLIYEVYKGTEHWSQKGLPVGLFRHFFDLEWTKNYFQLIKTKLHLMGPQLCQLHDASQLVYCNKLIFQKNVTLLPNSGIFQAFFRHFSRKKVFFSNWALYISKIAHNRTCYHLLYDLRLTRCPDVYFNIFWKKNCFN